MKTEKEIQNDILHWLSSRPELGRFFEADVGQAVYQDKHTDRERRVSFGIKGQADIWGIARGGLHVEIEVKDEDGEQSTEQKTWQRMVERFNGLYVLARSVDDVQKAFFKKGIL